MAFVPVQVRIGLNAISGKPDRSAPMLVWAEGPDRLPATCEADPAALEQIPDGELGARFEGEWDGERWRFGKRLDETA